MIQLRWLTRPCKVKYPDGIERTSTVETVLQYRQYVDKATYAGTSPFPNVLKRMDWTDWQDVPRVQEELP